MHVQRSFRPKIAETLEVIPIDELEIFLEKFKKPEKVNQKPSKESRWKKIARRVENDPELKHPKTQETLSQLKNDMQEFRDNFDF